MAVNVKSDFDVALFKRSYETWDVDALLSCYAPDVEIVQIGRDNPPSAPSVRSGHAVLRGMFEHCAEAGVRASVENIVAGEERFAATVTCEFPGGRRVVANSICDVQDGVIQREQDVVIGDAA